MTERHHLPPAKSMTSTQLVSAGGGGAHDSLCDHSMARLTLGGASEPQCAPSLPSDVDLVGLLWLKP